jgi:NADH-quinone oxidoreductase subunit N
MNYLTFLQFASPEAVMTLTALLVIGVHVVRSGEGRDTWFACSLVSIAGILATLFTVRALPTGVTLFHGMIVASPLSALFKTVCLVLALLTVLLARDEGLKSRAGEYLALLLFATVGLMLLVGSMELLMIFIGLELTGLSLYVMTGFDKSSPRSAEAGLKYFLFGSTASAFMLFGLSLVYGICRTTELAGIAEKLTAGEVQPLLAAGIIMTLVGFAFKIAAAPFHLWAPDAYQGAPLPSATFIASASKVASFVVLGNVLLGAFHPLRHNWQPLLAGLAALSILVGNFAALAQGSVRRLLAYSAVAHAGYTLLGLIAAGKEGFAAALFYTSVYALTTLGAFGVTGVVMRETGGDDLSNFTGLRARSPFLAGCLAVFILSLAGLPPLAGFFGKFYLFAVLLKQPGSLWLVALALAGSLVSLYYYLAILKAALVDSTDEKLPAIHLDTVYRRALLLIAASVTGLGLMPNALLVHILAAL